MVRARGAGTCAGSEVSDSVGGIPAALTYHPVTGGLLKAGNVQVH